MTPDQRNEAVAKITELEAISNELRDRIQVNTERARQLNSANRQMLADRAVLLSQLSELRNRIEHEDASPSQIDEGAGSS